ncbi:hypothetical protein OROHE_021930 [Orobanche hederae]
MAEKNEQPTYPIAPAAIRHALSDAEHGGGATHDAGDLRKKKRNKCILRVSLFAAFQIAVILIFSLTVMKVKTPKFRVRSAELSGLAVGTRSAPSFSATMNATLTVRNTNFGPYKYEEAAVEFSCRGAPAGKSTVRRSRASFRSTEEIEIVADLKLGGDAPIASDLSAGILRLTAGAKLIGRVELFAVMKKKKSTEMDCSMDIGVATKQITNIACK